MSNESILEEAEIRLKIKQTFCEVFSEHANGVELPEINEELVLLDSGLDSLGFAILVTTLEENLGFDPFDLASDAFYPQKYGEFVDFYIKHQPT